MFDRMIHSQSTFRPRGATQRDHALDIAGGMWEPRRELTVREADRPLAARLGGKIADPIRIIEYNPVVA